MARAKKEGGGKPAKGNGKAKGNGVDHDDDFDQGGPDGPAKLARESASRGLGDNSGWEPNGETLDEFFELADRQDDEVEQIQEQLRLKAEPFKEKIKSAKAVIGEARDKLVDAGYPTKELNTLLKQHRLRRQADRATKELDDGQKERHHKMEEAFRKAAGIPGSIFEYAATREQHAGA